MQVRVTGRHIEVTPPIREHVERRLAKLEHIFHNLLDAHAILFPEGERFVSDITVTGNHVTLHIREHDEDMYTAVDKAVHKLERQVRRHKDRVRRRKKTSLSHVDRDLQAAEVAAQEWDGDEEDDAWVEDGAGFESAGYPAQAGAPGALATAAPAGPMTLDEAIAAFDTDAQDFLAFINPQSDSVDVLFRRPDGQLGLITRA